MNRVAFLVQSLRLSGGHQVVLEHARQLSERHGFDVSLVVTHHQAEEPWPFEGLARLHCVDLDDIGTASFDLVIATWWDTVRFLDRVPAKRYAYFVQSMEDRFSQVEPAERHLAALTYRLGLPVVTEARWIARLLRQMDPDTPCHLVRNGVHKGVFPLVEEVPVRGDGPLRVLVEGGSDWLKGVPEALAAINLCHENPEVTVVGSHRDLRLPPNATLLEPVPQKVLSELYARHDVLLKTSRVEGMYGPPLEAFHRGATVVTTPVTGHEEYVEHGSNALVTDWDDPEGTARLLDLLSRDRRLLHLLRTNAVTTARTWPDWQQAGDMMAAALHSILASEQPHDPMAMMPLLRESRRFALEAAHRSHHLRLKLQAEGQHIEKLESNWHQSLDQVAALTQNLSATSTRLDMASQRIADQDAAITELNMRFDRRLLRLTRRALIRLLR